MHGEVGGEGASADPICTQRLSWWESPKVGGAGDQQPVVGTVVRTRARPDHRVHWVVAVTAQSEGLGAIVHCGCNINITYNLVDGI